MIKSMTGFAKTETSENGLTVNIEIKSLNGRFLEINCKMPRNLNHRERELRELVRQFMDRGTVSIFINVDNSDGSKKLMFNENAAILCYESLNNLREKLKIRETVKLEHVLQLSDNFIVQEVNDDEKQLMYLINKGMRNALKSLDEMRMKEGQQIAKDIKMRIGEIEVLMNQVEEISMNRVPDERQRLRERIAMLFESDEIDEQRLQTEMVLLADKLDVTEECTRMRSHIIFFNEIFRGKESSGRKLNFLLQEMNREVNTVGSKITDASAAKIVVAIKEELEKIREQVQNIE